MTGCGGPAEEDAGAGLGISLGEGTYGGVGLGDTEAEMKAAFGGTEPSGGDQSGAPLGDDETPAPHFFNPFGDDEPRFFRYEHVAFFYADGKITTIMVTDPAATTDGGLSMGSDLDRVRALDGVNDLSCGVVNEGTEYEPYAASAGRTASGYRVWFGGDPLANITISTVPLDGV